MYTDELGVKWYLSVSITRFVVPYNEHYVADVDEEEEESS